MRSDLVSEAIGSAMLLFVVVGSGAVLFTGGDPSTELLAHGLAVGLALGALIAMFIGVSGAHFNPAVTFAFWRRGDMSGSVAGSFVVAQTIGASVGVILAHLSASLAPIAASAVDRSGFGVAVSEGIATFGLVFVILRLVDTDRLGWIPAAVGSWVGAMIVGTSSTGFANPAVTIARTFTETATGIAPRWAPGFVAAQIVGAWAAVALADGIRTKGTKS